MSDVPDVYTYSDEEPQSDEGIRRLTSSELRTSPRDLYDDHADWNLGAWRTPRRPVLDVFEERECRVEITGFMKESDDKHRQRFSAKHFAEECIRKFALSHGIEVSKLKFNGVCSGAGDVRVVYSDNSYTIAIRAL